MKTFISESQRYEYPLGPSDFVIDAGGYEGRWAWEIYRRYKCRMLIFEPIKEFFVPLQVGFLNHPEVSVVHGGLGGADCGAGTDVEFHVQNDSTGKFAGSPKTEMVHLYAASYVIGNLGQTVSLLKLNIEGLEFDVLWNLLDKGLMPRIRFLQVQFHPVIPQAGDHRESIRKRLAETHEEMYCEPFVWEGWKIK